MARKVSIGNLASEVMKQMEEYSSVTAEGMKKAVNSAGKTVRQEIKATAPARSGDYAKSWSVKKANETSTKLELTVYSRNRYQLAHFLEYGHGLHQGGRTRAFPHISEAEAKGAEQLENDIERMLRNG